MSVKETVEKVMRAFDEQSKATDILPEIKLALNAANTLLDVFLEELRVTRIPDEKLDRTLIDAVIVGTIITVLMLNDDKYDLQDKFGKKYLYPLAFKDITTPCPANSKDSISTLYSQGNFLQMIGSLGKRALTTREIPFTGTIDYRVFPLLKGIGIEGNYFADYQLIVNPRTMDTTKRSLEKTFTIKINKIDDVIKSLTQKIGKMEQHVTRSAPAAAEKLLEELKSAKNRYDKNLKDLLAKSHEDFQTHMVSFDKLFVQECTAAINKAKSQLKNDLNWGPYLQNLLIKLTNAMITCVNIVPGIKIGFFEPNVAKSVTAVNQWEQNELPQLN